MSVQTTKEVMSRYVSADHSDTSMMADDVAFTIMATGETYETPEGVQGMLNYFYHLAFEATAEPITEIYGESNAMLEATFVGKHIGEFAGIPATGKSVRVPLCVVYDIEDDMIKAGRVYFEMPALMAQLGIEMG
ncbi:MAG: ester cyclase [Candidatus Promineifilaceae bacterium]|jgi:steroid delta-isomerase-like uncharacterized protein